MLVHFFHVYVVHVAFLERIGLGILSCFLLFRTIVGEMSRFAALKADDMAEISLHRGRKIPIVAVAAIVVVALIVPMVGVVTTSMVVAIVEIGRASCRERVCLYV